MTVSEMLRRMSSSEFSEWKAYYGRHPWGEEREDMRAGMIAAPLLSCWSKRSFKPSEWVMDFTNDDEVVQDSDNMRAMLEGLTKSMKGKRR